jgi:hypothetical protein
MSGVSGTKANRKTKRQRHGWQVSCDPAHRHRQAAADARVASLLGGCQALSEVRAERTRRTPRRTARGAAAPHSRPSDAEPPPEPPALPVAPGGRAEQPRPWTPTSARHRSGAGPRRTLRQCAGLPRMAVAVAAAASGRARAPRPRPAHSRRRETRRHRRRRLAAAATGVPRARTHRPRPLAEHRAGTTRSHPGPRSQNCHSRPGEERKLDQVIWRLRPSRCVMACRCSTSSGGPWT